MKFVLERSICHAWDLYLECAIVFFFNYSQLRQANSIFERVLAAKCP